MSFFDKVAGVVKSVAGMADVEEYETSDSRYDEAEEEQAQTVEARPVQQKRSKVVPIGSNSNMRESIGIVIINSFSETYAITRELKARRPVIFSVAALDYADARRVVDYVSGTIYGIDGDVKKVEGSIFLATPSHISIEMINKATERMKEVSGIDVAL